MQTKHVLILFVLIAVLFFVSSTFAQLSPYQGIINPYERYGGLGGSFGSVIIAEPDAVPAPLDNPAGIVFQRAPQVFAGMNMLNSKYEINYRSSLKTESIPMSSKYSHGQIAGSYPFNVMGHETALAVSLVNIPAYEFEQGFSAENNSSACVKYQRSGNVGTCTIGASIQITRDLFIGTSYTRWMGSWTWDNTLKYSTIAPELNAFGKGDIIFNSNSLNLGVIKQIYRLSIGILLQSPFTLLTCNNAEIKSGKLDDNFNIKQRCNGAASTSISYRINEKFKAGVGYRYLGDLKQDVNLENSLKFEEKINFHKLSVAGEYILQCRGIIIPVYLAFQRMWLNSYPANFPVYIINYESDTHYKYDSIQMGINWYYKSLALHMTGGWQQNLSSLFNVLLPPTNAIYSNKNKFKAEKTIYLVNFGISYFIK